MKVFHLIEKLRTLNPNLTVSFELAGWVEVPDGAGECGEMMYRERRREKGLDATCKLRPDDVQPIADHLVISLRQIVRYERPIACNYELSCTPRISIQPAIRKRLTSTRYSGRLRR